MVKTSHLNKHASNRKAEFPNLGLGLGLRNTHFDYIRSHWPAVDWFEAITENFMDSGGQPRRVIQQIAERYPIVLHGVSLSIGSTDPINLHYLNQLKKLANEIQPAWVSDHLCWTGINGLNSHDLLPVPLNPETLKHIVDRVNQVQDFLERPLVLENPSTYISFSQSTLSEPDFFRELVAATDCKLLLDVNNVYVSCFNADLDPIAYLQAFPCKAVVQMHLAGHQHCGTHIIDTHDGPVCSEVWALYQLAYQLTDGAATLLEWDGNIPEFSVCHAELLKAKAFMQPNHKHPIPIVSSSSKPRASVSTPVDFLVPKAMSSIQEHQS